MQTNTPLLTDLYQLTMAYGYFQLNRHEQMASFELSFRHHPFKGHFAVYAGVETVVDFLCDWRFSESDLTYLSQLTTQANTPMFSQAFLDYLANLRFTGTLLAMSEGTPVFAHLPLLRIEGPLLQCQLLESPLLNVINFQTLIATKAARIGLAAAGDPVIEFGLRRAQGPDGALSASRAAYIGGCAATSNTLAGKLYDIPVRGTHAHSWVTAFESELQAFDTYANLMPHNSVFLVDTYHSATGIQNAITVGKKLRAAGGDLHAIRLDSGDLAAISKMARDMLDEAGFTQTRIMASNNLDEYVIRDLKQAGAKINMWGVGTHLVTAYDQPALDGVYKMTALCDGNAVWQPTLKLSEQPIKISTPGRHQVRRFFAKEQPIGDVIYDLDLRVAAPTTAVLLNEQRTINLDAHTHYEDLLSPIVKQGQRTVESRSIHAIRDFAAQSLRSFLCGYPDDPYPIALETRLAKEKEKIIADKKRSYF